MLSVNYVTINNDWTAADSSREILLDHKNIWLTSFSSEFIIGYRRRGCRSSRFVLDDYCEKNHEVWPRAAIGAGRIFDGRLL